MLGLDAGTIIALSAMLISFFGAVFKYIDRRRQLKKEQDELNKKKAISDVERDSIVVRGAEGALLLMEKTLKTANEECTKRIQELEEELNDLRCENSALKQDLKEMKNRERQTQRQLDALNDRLRRIE